MIFEHLRRIFTDQEKAEGVVKLIFSFSLTPPNVPVLIPKQFSDFEKNQKKSKKDPLYTKNKKRCHFKGRKSGQIDLFLFFDPPKCACSDSKTVFESKKCPKKTPFTPKMSF